MSLLKQQRDTFCFMFLEKVATGWYRKFLDSQCCQ